MPNSIYHNLLNHWLFGIDPINNQLIGDFFLITFSISLIIIIVVLIRSNRRFQKELRQRQTNETHLKEREETLKQIINSIPGAVYQYQIDAKGEEHLSFMSEGIKKLYGFSPEAVIDNPQLMWDVIVPKTRSRVKSSIDYSATTLTPWQCEFEINLADGQKKWIKGESIPTQTENAVIWNGILVNISQQKWQEQIVATQHKVLEELAKGEELDIVLTQLNYLIEQQTQNLIASVLLLEENQLWHYGNPQLPTEYLNAINGIEIGEGQGSCGTAAARGESVITTNIETDPLWKNYQALAQTYNLKACWSVPIFSSEQTVLGTFSLYSPIPRTPYPWEEALIDTASKLAQLAIERKQQEQGLQQQAQQEKLLSQLTGQIRCSLNLQTVLDSTVTQVREFLKADRVLVYYLKQDSGEIIAESVEQGWESLLTKKINDPCLQSREFLSPHLSKQIQNISDINQANLSPCHLQMLKESKVQANLVIGIFQSNQLWGFLIAQQCAHPRQWQLDEINFLENLSEQVGIAIQQAELYQQSQTELLQQEQLTTQLRHEAMHDSLTQLPNRNLLMARLHDTLQGYQQYRTQDHSRFALLFLDLNGFKQINDTLGHDVGDQVLITVAKRLQDCLRERDTVARLGGDEFVVILEGIHIKQQAIEVANRINEKFATPIDCHGQPIDLSTSIGIVMDNHQYAEAAQMLRDADAAMYQAKQKQLPYLVFNT